MTNLYQILGLQPNATQSQIRAAYLRLAGEHHPDRNVDGGAREVIDREKFKRIVQAYEVLRDTEKKRRYDDSIGIGKPVPFPGNSNGVVYQGMRPGAGLHRRDVPDGWVRGMGRSRRFQAWIWPLGFFVIGSIIFFLFLQSLLRENEESHYPNQRSVGRDNPQLTAAAGAFVADLDLDVLGNAAEAVLSEEERPQGSKPTAPEPLPSTRSKVGEQPSRAIRGGALADELLRQESQAYGTPQILDPVWTDSNGDPTLLFDDFGPESLPPNTLAPSDLDLNIAPSEIVSPNQGVISTFHNEPSSEANVELDHGGGGDSLGAAVRPRRSRKHRNRNILMPPGTHGPNNYSSSNQGRYLQRFDTSGFSQPNLPLPPLEGPRSPSLPILPLSPLESPRSASLDEMEIFDRPRCRLNCLPLILPRVRLTV